MVILFVLNRVVERFARSQAPAWECGLGSSCFQKHLKLELENNGFPSWSLGTSQGMSRRLLQIVGGDR